MSASVSRLAGRAGMGASLACAAHCLAAPLLTAALPLVEMRRFVSHEMEWGLAIASIGLSAVNLCWGVRVHRRWDLFTLLATSAALVIGSHALGEHPLETPIVIAGALGVALSVFLNRHLCATCAHCDDD